MSEAMNEAPALTGARVVVITASTRAAAGVYPDTAGALAAQVLGEWGAEVESVVVPDADIGEALRSAIAGAVDLVLTTGGTGISPTDRTPDVTAELIDAPVPGLAEAIRSAGVDAGVPTAVLSRGIAGVVRAGGGSGRANPTLVVNLPGSRGGVKDALAVLAPVLPHALSQLNGGDH